MDSSNYFCKEWLFISRQQFWKKWILVLVYGFWGKSLHSQNGLHVSLLSCVLVATKPRCGLKWLPVSHTNCRINLWFSWSIDYVLIHWGSDGYIASQSGLHVSLLSCVLVATKPRCGLKWLHVSHANCRINLWFSWSIDYVLIHWGSNGSLPDACLWSHCWTTYLLVWMKSLPSLELVGCG